MAKPKGPRFSYVQKHSPDYKKPYGSSYTERQIAILSGFIPLENIREAELGLLFRKAEQMGDIDNYEIAKMLYDLKMDPGKYFPRYTIEQAKDIIQSHIPWKIVWEDDK